MDPVAEFSRYLIPAFWLIWLIGWIAAAGRVKRTRWRESGLAAFVNRFPMFVGILLLGVPRGWPTLLSDRLFEPGSAAPIIGTVCVGLGLAFAGWARWHLGRNWSGHVTVKEGHTLVRSGPYRTIRHPIYSGLGLALVGTALAIGTARALLGAGLIMVSFVIRTRVEEARMRATFPEYDDYRRHSWALVPPIF